uniref:4-hydroxyphenylpyruvate dioxygenase-like n=1 Tax=Rhizophora mucronata TaxID=61149 RepID=A0A2P2NW28_RHIMU
MSLCNIQADHGTLSHSKPREIVVVCLVMGKSYLPIPEGGYKAGSSDQLIAQFFGQTKEKTENINFMLKLVQHFVWLQVSSRTLQWT